MKQRTISEALLGRTITAVHLYPDGKQIKFILQDRPAVILEAVGDCCSESWIESLDNPSALTGKVSSVEDIPMPDLGNISGNRHVVNEYGEVKYYGLKIVTDKGHCVIDYRNDSNGYYGGELIVSASREDL